MEEIKEGVNDELVLTFNNISSILHSSKEFRQKEASLYLSSLDWRFLGRGCHCIAYIKDGLVLKFSALPLHLPTNEELKKYPLLKEHFLRPLLQSELHCVQNYAFAPKDDNFSNQVRALRKKFLSLYGRAFDTCKENCGIFRGKLIIFDPSINDPGK